MANTIDWGQGAVNNTIDWGKGKTNATNNWGAIYDSTAAGETNITGSGGVTPFVNEYSMSLDGVDEYFNGASTFSELDGQNKATFSMWVKPTSFSVGRILFSITKNTTVGNCQVMMFVDTSARLRGFVSTTGTYIYSNASVLTLNTWHHILFCIDLSQSPVANRGRIFVDGVDQTGSGFSQLNLTTLPTSNSELYIGEDKNGYQNPFLNNIDEFAMWVGTDQRANVSDIYNGGVPFDLSTLATAPSHWWRMGDNDTWSGSQWTLSDNIGSYDLTSANMEEADRLPISPNSYSQNSFSFDGVDEYFTIANNINLQISDTFSISQWIKFTGTSQQYVTNFGNDYGTYVSNGKFAIVFRNTANTQKGLISTININDGQWHHVLAIKTTTNLYLYVDGVLESNAQGDIGRISTRSSAIGAIFNGSTFFNGNIDEVALWNSDQSSNVATIFNNGTPNDISSLSPISWWRMGEQATWSGSAWTLTDQGSGGNDATSVNMEEADKTGDQAYVI